MSDVRAKLMDPQNSDKYTDDCSQSRNSSATLDGTTGDSARDALKRCESGTVGGAGWGNKTGEFRKGTVNLRFSFKQRRQNWMLTASCKQDSIRDSVVEGIGHVLHNDKIVEKGRQLREKEGRTG